MRQTSGARAQPTHGARNVASSSFLSRAAWGSVSRFTAMTRASSLTWRERSPSLDASESSAIFTCACSALWLERSDASSALRRVSLSSDAMSRPCRTSRSEAELGVLGVLVKPTLNGRSGDPEVDVPEASLHRGSGPARTILPEGWRKEGVAANGQQASRTVLLLCFRWHSCDLCGKIFRPCPARTFGRERVEGRAQYFRSTSAGTGRDLDGREKNVECLPTLSESRGKALDVRCQLPISNVPAFAFHLEPLNDYSESTWYVPHT